MDESARLKEKSVGRKIGELGHIFSILFVYYHIYVRYHILLNCFINRY